MLGKQAEIASKLEEARPKRVYVPNPNIGHHPSTFTLLPLTKSLFLSLLLPPTRDERTAYILAKYKYHKFAAEAAARE